jgi:hypothetical protein
MPAEEPTPTEATNLDAALAYARRGWRVVPIPPGKKHPGIAAWQTEGTTDEARIRHWWTQAPDHGIGIVTGAESGVWVLDVDVNDGKAGDDTLAELEATHGLLPDTYEVVTGSGGRHIYFTWPTDGTVVRNNQSGRLGPGLDVRGEGGQVLAPPTIHPNGTPYAVEAMAPAHTVPAPAWIIAALTAPVETTERERPPPSTRNDRPGDQWAEQTTWAQILEPDGWTLAEVDGNGEHYWTRPGKDKREGSSATTGHKGSDVLKVFTTSMAHAGLVADETYTKIGYLAATRFNGDHGEAAGWLRSHGYGDPLPDASSLGLDAIGPQPTGEPAGDRSNAGDWSPFDLEHVMDGAEPPMPTILAPLTGPPLLYPGAVNSIFGEAGTGKTWVAHTAAAEVVRDGGHVLIIDLEDTPHGTVSRLLALGLTRAQIATQVHYVAPQTPWGAAAAGAIAALVDEHHHRLVIIDSTGEAMAMGGVKGNNDDEVAQWFRHFPRYIADRGPAVLVVDHIPKATDAPSGFAIGSQRKIAAVSGAAYRIEAVTVPSKTANGLLKVVCAKDRHGNHTKGHTSAMVALSHGLDGSMTVDVTTPGDPPRNADGTMRPTIYMERVSRCVEEAPGLSGRQIESRVDGKAKYVRQATTLLIVEGYIGQDPVARGFAYKSIRPYRISDDPMASEIDDEGAPRPASPPRPTASPQVGDAVQNDRVPLPPPLRGRDAVDDRPEEPEMSPPRPAEESAPTDWMEL